MIEKQEKRQIILEVAAESFEHYGYRKTVIDEIVREAGIAKGTFYLYFKSKEQLFIEVVKDRRKKIMDEYYALIADIKSPEKILEITLRYSLETLKDHPLLAKISAHDDNFKMVMRMVDDPALQTESKDIIDQFRHIFEKGIELGELRKDMNLDIMPLVFGSMKLFHYYRDAFHKLGYDDESITDTIVDLAMNGIKAK